MIGLFVGDLALMVTFYREVIGVEIDWDGEGSYVEFSHEGIRLALVSILFTHIISRFF